MIKAKTDYDVNRVCFDIECDGEKIEISKGGLNFSVAFPSYSELVGLALGSTRIRSLCCIRLVGTDMYTCSDRA